MAEQIIKRGETWYFRFTNAAGGLTASEGLRIPRVRPGMNWPNFVGALGNPAPGIVIDRPSGQPVVIINDPEEPRCDSMVAGIVGFRSCRRPCRPGWAFFFGVATCQLLTAAP